MIELDRRNYKTVKKLYKKKISSTQSIFLIW